ncbi:ABC transporter permease [Bacillus salitolerans]|uniref:ABC transporter permease n=1 Tax=Bacillus salitolerans TaxID=1437434 RepID=A0ABW4LWW3_9BACI
MNMLFSQCKAEFKRTVRNKFFVMFSIAMPVVFYFIFSSVIGDDTQVGGTDWKAYYLMSMTVFSVIGAAISTLGIRLSQERTQGWVKQLKVTPLPGWVYLSSKIVTQAILNIGIILLLFIIGIFVKGIELTVWQWILCGLWIWIGALPFLALGVLIGTSKTTELAQVFSNIVHLGLAILGGLWMPLEIMPTIVQNIGEWLPTYRYGHGAWNILAGESPQLVDAGILLLYLVIFMVLSVYISKRQEAIS